MIHQAAAKFVRDTRQDSAGDDERNPDRQRGMWTFLTWSFFLAQAVAAHEALAAGHGLQDGSEADRQGSSEEAPVSGAAPAPQRLGGATGENDIASQAKIAAAAGAAAGSLAQVALGDNVGAEGQVAGASAGGVTLEGAGYAGTGSVSSQSHADAASETPESVSTIVLPVDVAAGIGLELSSDPVLGLQLGDTGLGITINLGDAPVVSLIPASGDGIDVNLSLGGSAGLELDLNLGGSAPVLSLDLLGIDLAIGGADGIAGILGADILGPDALPNLTPVLGAVGSLTGMATSLFELPATTAVTSAAGNTLQSVMTVISDTLPVQETVDSIVASAGDILYPATSSLPVNDLFSGGSYTAYSVELQESVTADLMTASATAAVTTEIGNLGDVAPADFVFSSVVESINLRAIGDAFA